MRGVPLPAAVRRDALGDERAGRGGARDAAPPRCHFVALSASLVSSPRGCRDMPDLSAYPVTRKWPPTDPTKLQLYSLPTPNGVKVSVMLEETGLPYEAHRVSFDTNDQASAEFLSLNPYGKIPAIIDPDGPGGRPLRCSSRARSSCTLRRKLDSSCRGTLRAATRRSNGSCSRWLRLGPCLDKSDSSTSLPAGSSRTSARVIVTSRRSSASLRSSTRASLRATGLSATSTRSPISRLSRGFAT